MINVDDTVANEVIEATSEELVVFRGGVPMPRKLRYEHLSGQQKVAIVFAQLRHETSAQLLQAIGEQEAVSIATEIAHLPPLDRELVDKVLDEFIEKLETTRSIHQGGLEQARKLLAAAIGEEQADQIMSHLKGKIAVGPLAFLSQSDPGHIVPFLIDEHPQTVAVILAHMPPGDGSQMLDAMPPAFRTEVALRIATMDRVSPEAISTAAHHLASKLRGLGSASSSSPGGIPALVELLNGSERSTEKQVLSELEERNPELAEAVRARMFTFEDFLALEDLTLQVVLRSIEIAGLALAIKAWEHNDEVFEKINHNLSARAKDELREELDVMGPVRASIVDAAQSQIVRTVRDLEASGEITIARPTDELIA